MFRAAACVALRPVCFCRCRVLRRQRTLARRERTITSVPFISSVGSAAGDLLTRRLKTGTTTKRGHRQRSVVGTAQSPHGDAAVVAPTETNGATKLTLQIISHRFDNESAVRRPTTQTTVCWSSHTHQNRSTKSRKSKRNKTESICRSNACFLCFP